MHGAALAAELRRRGVAVQTLDDFAQAPLRRSGLVFGFGAIDEHAIGAALRMLALRPRAGP